MSKLPDASGKLSSEFELIARLSAGIRLSRRTILGAGDDCAIVARPRGQTLFTIDSLVENVHFDLRWGTAQALGARALAVNLSDIAAMGGRPTACVVNLAVREGIATRTLERIYAGLRDAAREASTDIVAAILRARASCRSRSRCSARSGALRCAGIRRVPATRSS
ncbi:MAG: thiamine-phosphate kinase [Candidatus Binatus sp.]